MVRRGQSYRTQAQKEGRSAGQREKRQLRERKRRLRNANLWEITASPNKTVSASRFDNPPVYGIYKDENDDWVVTLMATVRKETVPSSSRSRATETVVRERDIVTTETPQDGLEATRCTTKREALNVTGADTSNRVATGEYIVRSTHNPRTKTWKVDRDEYRDWRRTRQVTKVRRDDDKTHRNR